MIEECSINVGFHSNFCMFRQSGDAKTPLRPTIIDGIPFNPTYDPWENYHKLGPILFFVE